MTIDIKNSALLLIEFQYEWLNEEGKLNALMEEKALFLESIENAKKVISIARQTSLPIVHSGLEFKDHYPELGQAKYGLRAAIPKRQTFMASSIGSHFVKPFVPAEGEFLVQGRIGGSAFAGSNLDNYLRHHAIHTLYLMGYALHVCVESTMRAAHDLGYEVILIEDASAAFTTAQKNHVLHEVVHHFGTSIKSQDFIKFLKRGKKHEK